MDQLQFVRPLAQALPSHIRDTTDFIIRLKNLGRVPEDSILATLDVSSLYTNIDTDDGLAIIEEELAKTGQIRPSAKTLTYLLEKVLKLNNFTFDNHNFIQVKGTAMGTKAAPNFANVYMGRFEDTFVYRTEWYHYLIDWVRFIDDIFLIWKGSYLKCAVLSLTQDESLRARERHTTNRILLVTTYNPRISYIAEVANRNWHFLQSKERLAHIFRERPVIAYRRSKSLRDILVSTKLADRTSEGYTTTMGSCGPCNKPKCSWCVLINKTSTFTGTRPDGKVFDIFHTVNCQSNFVIYIIECRICRLQYVGKSETAFNLRLNNHRNHIKRGVNSCELSEHFLHNSTSHDLSKDITITIIEQIKRSNMTIERKKDILRAREIFWQCRLNTLQPNGLNERMG